MASLTAKTVRGWYRLHKWTSLICTAFLLMSCLTGLPLIFHDELDAILSHEVRPADLPASAPTANLDRMVDEARQKMPGLHPYAVGFDDDEPRVFVTMTPTQKPEGFRTVIFDRHTGYLLETGTPGKDLMSRVLYLHREIFMGLPGELLMGIMALLFVIALISGALVYGPFMRRLAFGTYRKTGPRRLRWFDLHNLLGIVTLAWALMVGMTGMMNALSTPLFGLWRAQTLPALLATYHGQPTPTHYVPVEEAVAQAAAALPGMQITSRLFTPALIDATTGRVIVAKGLPWYLRTLEVCRPLHFGDYGGMPLKILWAIFDLAAIAVLTSGVYLWLSRKSSFETELARAVRGEVHEGANA